MPSFLKNKIVQANKLQNFQSYILPNEDGTHELQSQSSTKQISKTQRKRANSGTIKVKPFKETPYRKMMKNVVKNYGQASCGFILNPLFHEIVEQECAKHKIDFYAFKAYVKEEKKLLKGLERFRNMLRPIEGDDDLTITYKKAFQALTIFFIQYYSIKWIYDGKVVQRMAHLKMRHQVLRRVKYPELFTQLKL